MAGTAAGIAKANAAREARRAALKQALRTANEQPTGARCDLVAAPLVPVGAVDSPLSAVPLDGQAVAGLLPFAVDVVRRVLLGSLRAPVAVRANAALRIVELAHKPGGGSAAVPHGMAEIFGALGKALTLRQRTLNAEDARLVPDSPHE